MRKTPINLKYQQNYSPDGYPDNKEYKKQAQASTKIASNKLQEFFIEITPTTVKQLTDELSLSILKGIDDEVDLIYVRFAETGGHCIDLKKMRLINTLNGKSRQIYHKVPFGRTLLQSNIKVQISPQPSNNNKLQYTQYHWYEQRNGQFRPLQQQISDIIENFYQNASQTGQSICEFTWQQHRFIIDLKENTLENTDTLIINHIQRRNIQKPYQEIPKKPISRGALKIIVWQYQLQPKSYEWNNYDQENTDALEKAYEKYCKNSRKSNTLNVMRNTSKYYIDFDKMIEYNLFNKESRQIRRFLEEG
ncbi:unnamed protein product (macronuclear) [Paramecium tetraurelia]|uniref:WWE domain-containing protein n=1 Tax=Paramecium tetraurelia TaxID=5888 RepID=A0BT74_PARTE|nr:uncharacterized protein GSPATT00031973001 [Paramecium tetraurelia]CAK61741.1 unnamed protein product [Paramecium tetraurelia]|eukprot:XP_001429139.1 hypothetical protein (macronuclear) [Paramecium tetraurelia strain d4-2]